LAELYKAETGGGHISSKRVMSLTALYSFPSQCFPVLGWQILHCKILDISYLYLYIYEEFRCKSL